MAGALRIPFLVDLLRAEEPEAIRRLAEDPRLDRRFEPRGPLVNRILLGRVRRVLRHRGAPLPPVAPRDMPQRAERQAALEAAVTPGPDRPPADAETLEALAAAVRGGSGIGPAAQQAIGRLFVPDYQAGFETWEAARALDAALRSLNPLARLAWALTGRVGKARQTLARAVREDPAGLHATGVAVHNLVLALERMRDLAREPGSLARHTAQQAATICLAAPTSVLRQAVARGNTPAGEFRPGTVVVLNVEAARAYSLRGDLAFLTAAWSRCPAHAWVPALLAAVWARLAAAPEAAP